MTSPGQKGKLASLMDNSLADASSLTSPYRIEVYFHRTDKGNLAGAVTVFKNNTFDLDANPFLSPEAQASVQELADHASKQTEVMFQDPIYFRESSGQWITWALDKVKELYLKLGTADILIKAPRVKFRRIISSGTFAKHLSNLEEACPEIRSIDRLLRQDFQYDPWLKKNRRVQGGINAKMGKR